MEGAKGHMAPRAAAKPKGSEEEAPVLTVQIVDQTEGTPFKAACNEDWREVCGDFYPEKFGISPCGFVAMVVAAQPAPTTAEELSALSARLSDLSYVRPQIRGLMERVVAERRAYFVGELAERYVTGRALCGTHAISGMLGQWEIADHLRGASTARDSSGSGSRQYFLRNVKVGTSPSPELGGWVADPTEEEFWQGCVQEGSLDSENVRAWMAEERAFRRDDGSALHFVQQRGVAELSSLDDWSRRAGAEVLEGGFSLIVDALGHYYVYMATPIDGVPTILRLDSIPAPPSEEDPALRSLRATLAGPDAYAQLLAGRALPRPHPPAQD